MSTKKSIEILTPVGRLVQGSAFEAQTTDALGNPLVVKSGANKGQPRQSYFVALAVSKNDLGVNDTIGKIMNVAREEFPQYFNAAGQLTKPDFALKITDGDSTVPNAKGIKPCDREGWKGCWIFKFNSGFAPKCFTRGGEAVIVNSDEIKCGYYIRIAATVSGNGSMQQPGVYLNHSIIELVGYGQEIKFGPTGEILKASPAALPAGASATPIAGAPITQMPAAAAASAVMPQYPVGVRPAHDFLNPGIPPAVPGIPPAAPSGLAASPVVLPPPPPAAPAVIPAEEKFLASNGIAYTRAQLAGMGWNDQQISTLQKA